VKARGRKAGTSRKSRPRATKRGNPERIFLRYRTDGLAFLEDGAKFHLGTFQTTEDARKAAKMLGYLLTEDPAPAASKGRKSTNKRNHNPDLLLLGNPRAQMEKAAAAYRRFHGVEPKTMRKGTGKRILIALGQLREIVYQPRRGSRRGPAWFHKFGKGAILAATLDGDLVIVKDKGSRLKVNWDRGIVG